MAIAEKLTTIAENQQKVYDAGVIAGQGNGYDKGVEDGRQKQFENHVARCSGQKNFLWAFAGVGWGNKPFGGSAPPNYRATEDMIFDCETNASSMYAYSQVSDTIATIKLVTSSGNAPTTFDNATALVTIRKLIVGEQTPGLKFANCRKLENITIEGVIGKGWNCKACPLTNETVQNIIDHLKDLTGQTTQTLTLKADVGAAVTDAQKAAITAKNWTLAY